MSLFGGDEAGRSLLLREAFDGVGEARVLLGSDEENAGAKLLRKENGHGRRCK